jgi:hypothetical protein
MTSEGLSALIATAGAVLTRGVVVGLAADGAVIIECSGRDDDLVSCDVLEGPLSHRVDLLPGEGVLVWLSEDCDRGVVLGRIAPARLEMPAIVTSAAPSTGNETPDELVIEAKHSLTLRVGRGSITIREDGKILIKGSDLVSHAQRVNRIKGGSVAIN